MPARLCLCIALLLAAAAQPARAASAASPIAPDIGLRVARDFADPVLAAFAEESAALRAAIDDLCREPSPAALEDARAVFLDTVLAWAPVSVLRFGPLAADNRFERVFFWPDLRGVTLRQVQDLLGSDRAVPGDLSALSVALQGLPALEYVLFGEAAQALGEEGGRRRCALAAAGAANLVGISEALVAGWTEGADFHAAFTAPAAGRDPYRSAREVAAEIVKAVGTALQFIGNAELLPPLGESLQEARGRRAPFWRSGHSFAYVAAQLDGVRALVAAAGFADGPSDGVNGYGRAVLFDVGHARDALLSLNGAPQDAFADAGERGRISYAVVAIEGARHTVNGELAGALGLAMGFNALDGD